MAVDVAHTGRRRRWGRRLLTALIVLAVILAVILTVADRLAASAAERAIAERVSRQLAAQDATSGEPQVSVEGVPFLTQVVAGRYPTILISLPDFAAPAGDGRTVRMPVLDIRADDVRAPLAALRSGRGDVIATTVTGTGTIDYAILADLVGQSGVTLSTRGGKLTASAPLEAFGRRLTVTGTANLTVSGDLVKVRFDHLTAEGLPGIPLAQNLLDAYARRISVDARLPELPLGLRVRKIEPVAGGLLVTAVGTEVPLQSAAA